MNVPGFQQKWEDKKESYQSHTLVVIKQFILCGPLSCWLSKHTGKAAVRSCGSLGSLYGSLLS